MQAITTSDGAPPTDEAFHNCLYYFVQAIEVLAMESAAQCEAMLVGAVHGCERYYPAFQFVIWAGKSAAEAMSAAMFDTEGEA